MDLACVLVPLEADGRKRSWLGTQFKTSSEIEPSSAINSYRSLHKLRRLVSHYYTRNYLET